MSLVPSFAKSNQDNITIDYKSASQSFNIKHCFFRAPEYLEAPSKQLRSATELVHWQGRPESFHYGDIDLPNDKTGCLTYHLKGNYGENNSRLKKHHPKNLLLKIDELLWRPNDFRQRAMPIVRINHDQSTAVSAPWRLIQRSALFTEYQMKPTPRYSDGFLVIGPIKSDEIFLGDSRLRLAVLPGKYAHKTTMIKQWIKTMASSVANISGEFPLKDVQVIVIMIDGQGEEVPWGQVNRAGGEGVLFVVNGNAKQVDLFSDWTAAHEFSHLLTPYTPNDRWLSEGFASYHQNISRLKNGLLDEKTAWNKLISGFERGKKSASKRNAPTLKFANRKHNMQMYWGGAVIALKAEVALQQQTQGRMTLSDALAGVQRCCLGTGRGWSAQELFTELDRISDTNVFSQLYETEVKKQAYPEFEKLLAQLGIRKTYYGGIVLNDSAPLSSMRKKIAGF